MLAPQELSSFLALQKEEALVIDNSHENELLKISFNIRCARACARSRMLPSGLGDARAGAWCGVVWRMLGACARSPLAARQRLARTGLRRLCRGARAHLPIGPWT
jgi:hypothetical protein